MRSCGRHRLVIWGLAVLVAGLGGGFWRAAADELEEDHTLSLAFVTPHID